MAGQKSKRQSRKQRNPGATPRSAPSPRREQWAEQRAEPSGGAARRQPRTTRALGTVGERPPSPFGGLPVSEIAIFAGAIGLIVGLIQGGGAALLVGLIVCALGVLEVTAREHFSGYRSHTTLLAAAVAVAAGAGVVAVFGQPHQRALLLVAVVPVYALMFWLLRKRFVTARQARVARPRAR